MKQGYTKNSTVREQKEYIAAVDMGSSQMHVLIAELSADRENFEVRGVGICSSRGLHRGVVINIEETVRDIYRAIEEAEKMAQVKIERIWVGISGEHISSHNSDGTVPIQNQEVSQEDIERVLESAQAVLMKEDLARLHVIPMEYKIDTQGGIKDPLGMSGVRLEVDVHIITGLDAAVQNVSKCVRRCGMEVAGLVMLGLASSAAVLTADEQELGVCLVDIGMGTTDLVIFNKGSVRHTAVIPVAGEHITKDIAIAFGTSLSDAEHLKIEHGVALRQLAESRAIEIASTGEQMKKSISQQVLADVIEPRVEELFSLIQEELNASGLKESLSAGMVLTGGTSRMIGLGRLAEEVLHLRVRQRGALYRGSLQEVVVEPQWAGAVGLLKWALEQERKQPKSAGGSLNIKNNLELIKKWFKKSF
ncbi:MAG: cell division protein FtsA [Ferrovum sp.]|nr:cell division protein FtsA [Ferrovum sp.]